MPTFVAGDVRNIQDYIFGSPRLLEMRGASALLDFFDRAAVPELVNRHGGHKVYSGGGNFLASFAEEARAEALIEAVRNAFFELTGSEGITLAAITGELYSTVESDLRRRLRRAKRAPQGVRQLASMPFLKRCESCGREGADETFQVPGAPEGTLQWVGPICARKHRMHIELREASGRRGRGAGHRVLGVPEPLELPAVTERLRAADLPADFQSLAADDDLAVVVADGNGLGDWFEGRDLEEIEHLSGKVDRALRRVLDEATEAAFGNGDLHPRLQVLICGGDDLVVALPARRGLCFARTLIERFEVTDGMGRAAGMSAGLLFAKPSFPFRQAHGLAVSLLGRAKERCRREGLRSALDFHRVKATQVQSMEREHAAIERARMDREGWSYGAAGPYSPAELASLLALAAKLRQATSSQRGRLREILSPRDDGENTPLHEVWRVPERVISELSAWRLRQETPPFEIAGEPSEVLVRTDRVEAADGKVWTYRRLALADALLLAEMEHEEGSR